MSDLGNREQLKKLLESPLTGAASAILPAVLTYALSRRVGKLHPEHEQLAEAIRKRGLGVVAPGGDKLSQPEAMLRYGTPHVKSEQHNLNPNLGAVYEPAGHDVGPHPKGFANAGLHPELNNSKHSENDYIRRMLPDGHITPPTVPLHPEIYQTVGLNGGQAMDYLQARLKAKHPQGYMLKPNIGEGTRPLTDQHNLIQEFDKLVAIDPEVRHHLREPSSVWPKPHFTITELMRAAETDPHLFGQLAKNLPPDVQNSAYLHGVLKNPDLMVSQDRLPLEGELRVHAIGPRVMRRATVARHDRVAGARTMLGLKSQAEKHVENQVEHLLSRLPQHDTKDRPFAMDVGYSRGPDGQINVHLLDMNATGWSGLLKNNHPAGTVPAAINMNKYVSELAGQDTLPLAAAKAVGAGAAGYGALTGARAIAGPPKEETAEGL